MTKCARDAAGAVGRVARSTTISAATATSRPRRTVRIISGTIGQRGLNLRRPLAGQSAGFYH